MTIFPIYIQKLVSVLLLFYLMSDLHGQFNGKIIDSETGDPLQFATIYAENEEVAVLSGPEGNFLFEDLILDSLWVRISHLGYMSELFLLHKNTIHIIRLTPDYSHIGEVTVTATQFISSLLSSTGSISLITPELINQNHSHTLTNSINQSPGVFMSDGTLSTNRLTIRGIGSRNPYGTSKIRIYLDDIPFTLIDGTSSPENINPDVLERIEILKGPSSAIYGAGLGGTVIMKPKFPVKEGLKVGIQSSLASWSTWSNSADISVKKENAYFTIHGKSLSSEAYRENSSIDRKDLFLGFRQEMKKGSIRFLMNYIDFKGGIPSSLNKKDYLENPSVAAPSWLAVKGYEDSRNLIGGIRFDYNLTQRLSSKTSLFSGYGDIYESRPFNIFDSRQYSLGLRQVFDYRLSFVELRTGFEAISEHTEWEIFRTNAGVQGETLNALGDHRSYFSGFLHSEITAIPRLRIEPGLSATIVRYRLSDRYENEEDLSGNYNYSPQLSPRLSLNYQANKSFYFYSSAGHGFSPPGLEETLMPEGESNTNLRPETGWTWDGGLRGSLLGGRLYFDFGLYRLRLNDLLLIKRISEDTFMGVNAGKTRHHGAEMFLRYQLIKPEQVSNNSLLLTSSFTFSKNHFVDFIDDGIDYSGNELPGIPLNYFVNALDYKRREHFRIIINHRIYGKQWMNDGNTEQYGGHSILDLQVSGTNIRISSKFNTELFFGINNFFNRKYASMILVNAPSFGSASPRYYYPGNPRNYLGGIRINFSSRPIQAF